MTTPPSPSILIRGGEVLHEDGTVEIGNVHCAAGRIEALDAASADVVIDATGALVLPGIIDVHGDAFERAVMPRGSVFMDLDLAISETRSALLAAGITTAFVSVTDGWEPGLRSRATLRRLVDHLRHADAVQRVPRLEIHVRHERCNTHDADELLSWVRDGSIRMLSFNDHTPGGIKLVKGITPTQAARSGLDLETLTALQEEAISLRPIGLEQEHAIALEAGVHGVTTASHDPHDDDDLQRDLALGVAIAEFPTSIALAQRYRDEGVGVLLGAPNLVRGQSHLGNLSVRDAWAAGAVDLLCSDYHYPSLLQAPFVLQALGASLHEAWQTVAAGPARAAGLTERGRIAVGTEADLIVVEPPDDHGQPARIRAAVVDGRLASLAP